MRRETVLFFAVLFWLFVSAEAKESVSVNISLPVDSMLIRANVPIFGSVRVPKATKLKKWRLEYGLGPNPSEWILIKEGTQAIPNDPNEKGQVKWNPNVEPEGNITNWATGLGSYAYGSWRQNLNGLYTLRLVAEAENAPTSEARRLVFVGEAIIRTAGGTATSADAKCRALVAPYAFGGDIGRVVAIIKQVPRSRKMSGLTGVEDTRREARNIYDTAPVDSELLSPIYRLYPNGLRTEPPALLEFEYDPLALAGLPSSLPVSGVTVRQFNPENGAWDALNTEWFGTTARAAFPAFAEARSYVAIMRRKIAPAIAEVTWHPDSALKGAWVGKAPPHSTVFVTGPTGTSKTIVDDTGRFRLPFELDFFARDYVLKCVPVEGESLATEKKIRTQPGPLLSPVRPTLTVTPRNKEGDYFLISSEDSELVDFNANSCRSIACKITLPGANREIWKELAEEVPGTGIFVGELRVGELSRIQEQAKGPATFVVANESKTLDLPDTENPEVSLKSTSHPGFLFTTARGSASLATTSAHSRAKVETRDEAWRISGAGDETSARIVNWPVPTFPVKEWPLVGFTYQLFEDAPWQLLVRNGMDLAAYHFTTDDSEDLGIPVYARSSKLIADGRWQYWQANLQEGKFPRISGISFGSWVKTGYRRVDPGFKGQASQILHVRDIYVGKSYSSRNVEMQWDAVDRSGVAEVIWWVDQSAESQPPEVANGLLFKVEDRQPLDKGRCRFSLPADGRWFFHLQAKDEKGNLSKPFHFPLFVYGSEFQMANVKSQEEDKSAPPALIWKQPEGSLKLPLKGFGASLDSRSLQLVIHGRLYPISRPIWDAGSETLTVDPSSFAGGAPLGFDNEETTLEIRGRDFSGKPLANLPQFAVRFASGFSWSAEGIGGRLKTPSVPGMTWIASWEQPSAPWRSHFPGSANNTLVLMRMGSGEKPGREQTWLRPIHFDPSPDKRLYLRESFGTPADTVLSTTRTEPLPVFNAAGQLISEIPHSFTGAAWLSVRTAADSFASGRVRVLSRKGKDLTMRVLNLEQAKTLLSEQSQETIRLDAWLPPQSGNLSLIAPGDRRLWYGDANDTNWRKGENGRVDLEAGKDWRRVSVLLVPRSGFLKTPLMKLEGQVCW